MAPINESHRKNFETLNRAWHDGNVALVQCRRKSDGAAVAMICAVGYVDGEYAITPFAEMVYGNPFELYNPPAACVAFAEYRNDDDPDAPLHETGGQCTCDAGGSAGCPVHDEAAK